MSIRMMFAPALAAGLLAAAPVMAQAPAATAPVATAPAATAPAATTPAATTMPAQIVTKRNEVVEHRIAELHSHLKITTAEQKPFDDFAQAMRDNAARMDEVITAKRANAQTQTAVEQMKAYADLAQAHADEVGHLVGPFTTLYGTLSPEQKKMADQSFRDFANHQAQQRAVRPARG